MTSSSHTANDADPGVPTATRPGRLRFLLQWFDAHASYRELTEAEARQIDWLRVVPFIGMHLACLAVIWVGFSWVALGVAAGLYIVRKFVITGFYHRYFSHRTFKTSRWLQFVMAWIGCTCGQRSPMWWAAHHRHHHRHSDENPDIHSPRISGLLWSHTGWFLSKGNFATNMRNVRDWAKFPELIWLDRFDIVPVATTAGGMFLLGYVLDLLFPGLGTSGWQMLVWGFFISTIALYHATYTINSLAHRFGTRRYDTGDDSRNNFWLALLTLGEGWHNNHHHYPASVRQGFYWWEVDLTYYALFVMSKLGLIWDLRGVPESARLGGLAGDHPDAEDAH